MKTSKLNFRIAALVILFSFCSCQKEQEQITQTKEVSVLKVYAGSTTGYKDGPALEAQFENPLLIAAGPDKSLFIVEGDLAGRDPFIHGGIRIRKINTNGIVSTFFNKKTSNQGVMDIRGIAVDKDGCVFISDGNQIKKISSDGKQVIVVAGDGTRETMKDGPALKATFWEPSGLAFDKNGCLYIMDTKNNAVRILSNNKVSTLAGGIRDFDPYYELNSGGPKDGTGSKAEFDNPQFLTIDESSNVYVCGGYFPIVRKITPGGMVTAIIENRFSYESEALDTYRGITPPCNGNFYINRNSGRPVRSSFGFSVARLSSIDLQLTTLTENFYQTDRDDYPDPGGYPDSMEDGLNFPTGMVVVDKTLYICNTGEHRIRKIGLN